MVHGLSNSDGRRLSRGEDKRSREMGRGKQDVVGIIESDKCSRRREDGRRNQETRGE